MRHSRLRVHCAIVVALAVLLPHSAVAQIPAGATRSDPLNVRAASPADSAKKFQVEITPYVWALKVEGTTGVRDRTADIDISFAKALKHLKGVFMGAVDASYGRWSFDIDANYVKLGAESATPGPLFSDASLSVSQSAIGFGPRYRIWDTKPVILEILAGGRWWRLRNHLSLGAGVLPNTEVSLNKDWVDPFVGSQMVVEIAPSWELQLRGDGGGFDAGSRFTWQARGDIGYRVSSRWLISVGYRRVDVDFQDSNEGFLYDAGYRGPILSGTYRF